ncbi:MAG TPA: type II toxin-antitoxin system mRNA interferase toxin, RelE/StbE family [Flavobacterium sp.]|nr:type II toxin-antitoxin system mRNA interferase toxin, RelE/StbE family [Flavobacterium sp.]
MYTLAYTNQFKRDYKRCKKANKSMLKLHTAFGILEETGTLPVDKYKTHPLKGTYKDHIEAHIEPDWLLIWLPKPENEISLVRTGTHSELFG